MNTFFNEYSGFFFNWIMFRPDSMKKWIFKTDRPGLCCLESFRFSDSAHHHDRHHYQHHHHHHVGHFDHHHQKWGTPRSTCITKREKKKAMQFCKMRHNEAFMRKLRPTDSRSWPKLSASRVKTSHNIQSWKTDRQFHVHLYWIKNWHQFFCHKFNELQFMKLEGRWSPKLQTPQHIKNWTFFCIFSNFLHFLKLLYCLLVHSGHRHIKKGAIVVIATR